MDFITHVQAGLIEALPGIIEQYSGAKGASSLSEMEQAIKHMTHSLGNQVMRPWLKEQDGGIQPMNNRADAGDRRGMCGGEVGSSSVCKGG